MYLEEKGFYVLAFNHKTESLSVRLRTALENKAIEFVEQIPKDYSDNTFIAIEIKRISSNYDTNCERKRNDEINFSIACAEKAIKDHEKTTRDLRKEISRLKAGAHFERRTINE